MKPLLFFKNSGPFWSICLFAACLFGQTGRLAAQPSTAPKTDIQCGSEMSAAEFAHYRTIAKRHRAALAEEAANGTERSPTTIYAPVVFHIVRHSNGDGVSEAQVAQALEWANEKFAPANIQFFECQPPNIIVSNTLFNTTFEFGWVNECGADNAEYDLDAAEHVSNVLNIYCVNTDGWSWSAGPSAIANNCMDWLVLHQGHVGSSWLLAHEIGHYFALPHTFSGFDENVTRNPNNPCWNCEEEGDLFCDTPADHHNNDTLDGNLNGWSEGCVPDVIFDDCGVQVQPDGLNLMSYSNSACPAADKYFSAEQRSRMYFVAQNDRAYLHCPSECEPSNSLAGQHAANRTWRVDGLLQSTAIVPDPRCVNYQAGGEVRLLPGFRAEAGCLFNALIATCVDGADNPQPSVDRFSTKKPPEPAADFSMKAAPNPFTDELNLTINLTEKNTRLRARLLDLSGREVQLLMDEMVEEPQLFSLKRAVGELPPGVYFVEYQANAMRGVLKLVKM